MSLLLGLTLSSLALAAPALSRSRSASLRWPGRWYSRADAFGSALTTMEMRSFPRELVVAVNETVELLDEIADRFELALQSVHGDDVEVAAPEVVEWVEPGISPTRGPAAEMACTGYRVVVQCATDADADRFVVLLQGIGDQVPVLLAAADGDQVVVVRHPHGVTGAGTWVTSEGWAVDDDASEPADETVTLPDDDELEDEPEEAPVSMPVGSSSVLEDGQSWAPAPE